MKPPPPATASPTPARARRTRAEKFRRTLWAAPLVALIVLTHVPLLDLPYYWDEAGYFIPAAFDILVYGDPVPRSTLSNAHPPLVPAYIALVWKLYGFAIWVARFFMLCVALWAVAGTVRLAERVANWPVAVAAGFCTALYPVFFAQSTMAHLDMPVAALTMWALVFYVPRRDVAQEAGGERRESLRGGERARVLDRPNVRRWLCVAFLALAGLAKETAILVPLTLFGWEVLCLLAERKPKLAAAVCLKERRSAKRAFMLLLALVPLALWFAYHYTRTGYVFGNPEYFRYNVESTVNLPRIIEALWRRLVHVTAHMSLWALTLPAALAMLLRARSDGGRERPRIEVPVQILFGVLVVAHVFALSVVGGAILARYMLPVLPLVVIVCVSTLWRRVRLWPLVVALACGAFAYRCLNNPSYSFPWEENLAYRDFVLLHRDAARVLADKYPEKRVMTAWPATDELKNPYFGYLERPVRVFPVENFKREALRQASQQKSNYDLVFLYSTHGGLELEEAAQVLGGVVIYNSKRNGQWAAILEVSSKQ